MKTVMFVLLTVLLWGGEARAFVDEYGNCTLYIDGVPRGCTYSQPRATALHDGKRVGDVATCLAMMEAVMRAMDEFVAPAPTVFTTNDGCNTCTYEGSHASCTLRACTPPDEVERLEWLLFKAKADAEMEARRKKALRQWELGGSLNLSVDDRAIP